MLLLHALFGFGILVLFIRRSTDKFIVDPVINLAIIVLLILPIRIPNFRI